MGGGSNRGQGIGAVREVVPAAQLVERLVREYQAASKNRGSSDYSHLGLWGHVSARMMVESLKRTGRDRVVRNALIAAGNSGDPALVQRRDRSLEAVGMQVLRFTAAEVMADPDAVVTAIIAAMKARWEERRARGRARPERRPERQGYTR